MENNYNLIDGDGSPNNPNYNISEDKCEVLMKDSAIYNHSDIKKDDKFQKEDMVL